MDVAEKVAAKLGYDLIGRESLLEASIEYDVPEVKLGRAIYDAPSILDRFTGGKERYIAYMQQALTSRVRKDNVVYHGLAGQFLLPGISHVLKVRIIAPLEYRVGVVMERDNVARLKATSILRKSDEERYRWSRQLFLIDQRDSSLYDLVLNIDKCTVENAVDTVCYVVGFKGFQTTPESQKAMDDLCLACDVKARLVDVRPDVEVNADGGKVFIKVIGSGLKEEDVPRELKRIAENVPGVSEVRIQALGLSSLD
jgi:hypothetical protein